MMVYEICTYLYRNQALKCPEGRDFTWNEVCNTVADAVKRNGLHYINEGSFIRAVAIFKYEGEGNYRIEHIYSEAGKYLRQLYKLSTVAPDYKYLTGYRAPLKKEIKYSRKSLDRRLKI